jgi:carboxymethylenebutenolidase
VRLDLAGREREVHLARPAGAGPWPGVLVLHEIWGLNDDVRALADHVAAHGFLAAAPDLMGAGLTCMIRAFRDLSRGQGAALDVARAATTWLAAQPDCTGRVGVVGFCMGGGFALLLGVEAGVGAIAPCYGPVPEDPDHLARLCPTVASYGARDRMFRGEGERLREALSAAGVAHDVVVYPDVGHSFLNRGEPAWTRPALRRFGIGHDEAAAADAWARIFRFFRSHLADTAAPPGPASG